MPYCYFEKVLCLIRCFNFAPQRTAAGNWDRPLVFRGNKSAAIRDLILVGAAQHDAIEGAVAKALDEASGRFARIASRGTKASRSCRSCSLDLLADLLEIARAAELPAHVRKAESASEAVRRAGDVEPLFVEAKQLNGVGMVVVDPSGLGRHPCIEPIAGGGCLKANRLGRVSSWRISFQKNAVLVF